MEKKYHILLENSYLVKPSSPTFQGRMPLSPFDQIGSLVHIPVVFFYKPPPPQFTQEDFLINKLKSSLAMALVHFYPLAGRITLLGGGRMELNCNCAGAQLVESICQETLDQVEDISVSSSLRDLVPSLDYDDMENLPLLAAQLTTFKDGNVALCIAISHAVVDGESMLHFVMEWARLTSGNNLRTKPFLDRTVIQGYNRKVPPRSTTGEGKIVRASSHNIAGPLLPSPVVVNGETSADLQQIKKKRTSLDLLILSTKEIQFLKSLANNNGMSPPMDRPYTRFEVITAHIWRCACRARLLIHEQPPALLFPMNISKVVHPPLPDAYFGNMSLDIPPLDFSGNLLTCSLGDTAAKIRKAIQGVTSDFLHSKIGFIQMQTDLSEFQQRDAMGFQGINPYLSISSWLTFPIYDIDFGWGRPLGIADAYHPGDGDIGLLNDPHGDRILVSVCFREDYINYFKFYFYEIFGSMNKQLRSLM